MSLQPIETLLARNAIRREVVGKKHVTEVINCKEINDACNKFFRSRGMRMHTFNGDLVTDEPQTNKKQKP